LSWWNNPSIVPPVASDALQSLFPGASKTLSDSVQCLLPSAPQMLSGALKLFQQHSPCSPFSVAKPTLVALPSLSSSFVKSLTTFILPFLASSVAGASVDEVGKYVLAGNIPNPDDVQTRGLFDNLSGNCSISANLTFTWPDQAIINKMAQDYRFLNTSLAYLGQGCIVTDESLKAIINTNPKDAQQLIGVALDVRDALKKLGVKTSMTIEYASDLVVCIKLKPVVVFTPKPASRESFPSWAIALIVGGGVALGCVVLGRFCDKSEAVDDGGYPLGTVSH
jgi:hypothetical protein